MHELALSQNILDIARDHMGEARRLKRVVVSCGPFSGVEGDALEFCFGITAEHMGLGGARLEIRCPAAEAVCPACGARSQIDTMWAACDKCGHAPLTAQGGREFQIVEIEVEEVEHV